MTHILGIAEDRMAMIMVNARQRPPATVLRARDRVILASSDVAAMWRFLGLQNAGAGGVCDFRMS